MARLIDADEETRFANENLPDAHAGVITAFLRDCATVDAVPVVRCTDCWFYQSDNRCGWNGSTGWAPDDYCSYGERMADAKIGGAGL